MSYRAILSKLFAVPNSVLLRFQRLDLHLGRIQSQLDSARRHCSLEQANVSRFTGQLSACRARQTVLWQHLRCRENIMLEAGNSVCRQLARALGITARQVVGSVVEGEIDAEGGKEGCRPCVDSAGLVCRTREQGRGTGKGQASRWRAQEESAEGKKNFMKNSGGAENPEREEEETTEYSEEEVDFRSKE
ncbi:unnamed protein product [Protopolystoma xenopodis]|uniref:Uncharacterized protein n=1 Tax=Protopolystoma xenopodis TaxID=117903 RepID=A0A3S5A4Z3_9PLAT|nr:unnamed protein product [Protopolystoma xenopodis]